MSIEEAGARGSIPLSAFRYVQRTNEALVVPDATRDDRFAKDPFIVGRERCSLLGVPILNAGALRAVLLLVNDRTAGAFNAAGLDAVTLLAGQLAVCTDNALLYRSLEERVNQRTRQLAEANQKLEIISRTDALTSLANRRQFTEILGREWARAIRNKDHLAIVIADVDHFKRYNDHYGHLAGDDCLREVGLALSGVARRATDLTSRYGGEEFAIILPDTDAEGAASVAENVRAAVADLGRPHAQSSQGIVTISVGFAVAVPLHGDEPESVVRAADDALYRAKSMGRNRVCGGFCSPGHASHTNRP